MAEELVEGVLEIQRNVDERLLAGAGDGLEKVRQSLFTMRTLLLDAESRQSDDDDVSRVWLTELKGAVYDADDLFDDLSYRRRRRSVMAGNNKFLKEARLFFSASNQLLYGHKMVPRIRDLSARLRRLVEDRGKLSLLKQQLPGPNPTRLSVGPHVSVVDPVGRVADKDSVIEALLHRDCEENVGIVGIFGMGGVGKTTLARMVYDDVIMKTEFQSRLWVSVGRDFRVERILQDMMIQLSMQFLGLDSSPGTLPLSNKKVLLVLDDIQHDDPENWSKLRYLLEQGTRGTRILLTSRVATRAPVLMAVHHLGGLSEAESWSLFVQVASSQSEHGNHCLVGDREVIGREIINKCEGLPLAIKVLASMLRSRSTQDWLHFATQELPKADGRESGSTVMSVLHLSYRHLPPYLKPCFLYCSLFPKGQKIHVPRLINLWIAQGYVKPSDPSRCLEAIGFQHFMELLGRSFFEEVEEDELGDIVSCRMHDEIQDLATMVAGTEFVSSSEGWHSVKAKTRHAAFSCDPATPWEVPDPLFEKTHLRTLLFSNETRGHTGVLKSGCQLEANQLLVIASKFRLLRVLDLHSLDITRWPTSIGNLKFLTYLDLSENRMIRMLPDFIDRLALLETLNLDNCENLSKLPTGIKDLASLIHLGLENCTALTHMPRGIGHLTSVSTLSRFVLPIDPSLSKYSASLGELHSLNGLRGTLRIYNLSHAEGAQYEFEAANLKAKKDLCALRLEWSDGDEDPNPYHPIVLGDANVAMEALQPHIGLKRLEVRGYRGREFPGWLSSLTKLVVATFESCEKCQYLPPLHQLSGLKSLIIEGLTALKYVHDGEIIGESHKNFFPSLEKLVLSHCPVLLGWHIAAPTTLPQLALCRLSKLSIIGCPNLSSTSMPVFPSVKSVKISGSRMIILEQIITPPQVSSSTSSLSSVSSLRSLSQLESLEVKAIIDLESFPDDLFQNLVHLKILRIANCRRLKTLFKSIFHLRSLIVLSIDFCPELDLCDGIAGNDEIQWECFRSLHSLSIYRIPKLKSVPHWVQHLTSLWRLEIIGCSNLESLPDWMSSLHSLQLPVISLYPKLKPRCRSGRGVDLPKIVHIKNIVDVQKAVYGSCFEENNLTHADSRLSTCRLIYKSSDDVIHLDTHV